MDIQRFSKRGFTVVELILVIAIVAFLGATVVPIGSSFLVTTHFKNKTNELVSSLRTAQINSMNSKANRQWGVEVTASQIRLYADGDAAFSQTYSIPDTVNITQDTVVFSKLTGNPDSPTTFTITNTTGDSVTVTVNEVGTVDVN